MSDKTEQPTTARLKKAREEGDSGASSALSQSVAFLVGLSLLPSVARLVFSESVRSIRSALERIASHDSFSWEPSSILTSVLLLTVPLLLVLGGAGALTTVIQTGGGVAWKKLSPDLARLNPFQGMKNLISRARVFSVIRAMVAALLIGWCTERAVRGQLADLARTTESPGGGLVVAAAITNAVLIQVALVMVGLGLIDLLLTRTDWMRRLRMSKEEIKREHQENDGNPEVKAQRERAHQEVMSANVVANVKKATVVVINPTHLACALKYSSEDGDETPTVLARGAGDLARQIVAAAHQYGIPVVQDVPLARALHLLEEGDAIPEPLYEAVAAVLEEAWKGETPAP